MPRYCLLEDTAAVIVHGADATAFLNAQLSRDVPALGIGSPAGAAARAPLAGWHDARGRVRALFRVVPLADGYLLATDRSMLAPVLAALPKYVLRARVTIEAATAWRFAALVDADEQWCAAVLSAPAGRDWLVQRDGFTFVGAGPGLVHVAALGEHISSLGGALGIGAAPAADAALAAIRVVGLPPITPATSERFVAQMLNLDTLDAVSFSKGCYPGQEVIARIRYRGEVKRRLKRFAAGGDELPVPGSELSDTHGAAVGNVVSAAPAERGIELLAVVDGAAQDLRLGADRILDERPLPSAR